MHCLHQIKKNYYKTVWHKIVVQKKTNKKQKKNRKQYKPAPEKKRQKKKWKKERKLNGDSLCTLLTEKLAWFLTRNTAALWKFSKKKTGLG